MHNHDFDFYCRHFVALFGIGEHRCRHCVALFLYWRAHKLHYSKSHRVFWFPASIPNNDTESKIAEDKQHSRTTKFVTHTFFGRNSNNIVDELIMV